MTIPQRQSPERISSGRKISIALGVSLVLWSHSAFAGPPYFTDDPIPTDFGHFEIYAFGSGTLTSGGTEGEAGIDFNYGGASNLQLTFEAPFLRDPDGTTDIGNITLAGKYRFLTQESFGLDVAIFPHLVMPSVSSEVGDRHMSLFLPLWLQKDFGPWTIFGGGGCTLVQSRFGNDFCQGGLAVTREIAEGFRVGGELFHSGPEEVGGKPNTALGMGLTWDISDHHHLLAYWGPNLRYPSLNGRSNFYAAVLFAF